MSNAACIAAMSREIAVIGTGLTAVAGRTPTPWAGREIETARAQLTQARFHLSVAARIGVDPVIEVRA